MINNNVNIIGAGLAGCECALYLAQHGIHVTLYEMKPKQKSPAHSNNNFSEIVCSNSLKSEDLSTASGLLKAELELLNCNLLKVAQQTRVPAGSALAVDREKFSQEITNLIKNNSNIDIVEKKVDNLDFNDITVIATGPLTDDVLLNELKSIIGTNNCYFYDAMAPIIEVSSIDKSKCFTANRYDKGENVDGDYLNISFTKEEYETFYNELISANTVELKQFEDLKVFEGCMPVEVLAKRGKDSLRFGPLKPVGLKNVDGSKPYAVLQLRKENKNGSLVNMVGFQTNLTFPEQKRVFSLIPGLQNANFVKYGVMHRNSYINASQSLNIYLQLKAKNNFFICGQLCGVEGYVESIASGLYVAINIFNILKQKPLFTLPQNTCLGSIINYIINMQITPGPMNANFGIIPELTQNIRDKKLKKLTMSERSINELKQAIGG